MTETRGAIAEPEVQRVLMEKARAIVERHVANTTATGGTIICTPLAKEQDGTRTLLIELRIIAREKPMILSPHAVMGPT